MDSWILLIIIIFLFIILSLKYRSERSDGSDPSSRVREPRGRPPNPDKPLQSFAENRSTQDGIAAEEDYLYKMLQQKCASHNADPDVLIRILSSQNPGAKRSVILRKAVREFEEHLLYV